MYKGKHITKKRRLRWNKQFVLLVSIVALLLGIAGGSLAYLFTNTSPVENTFTAPTIGVDIEENFENNEKTNVFFTNTSDFPVYVRARIIENWTDKEGNVVAGTPDEVKSYQVDRSVLPANTDWFKVGDYYYYTKPVAANGGETSVLLDRYAVTYPEGHNYYWLVDVLAETVQAVPTDAVVDIWPVAVSGDGIISANG